MDIGVNGGKTPPDVSGARRNTILTRAVAGAAMDKTPIAADARRNPGRMKTTRSSARQLSILGARRHHEPLRRTRHECGRSMRTPLARVAGSSVRHGSPAPFAHRVTLLGVLRQTRNCSLMNLW